MSELNDIYDKLKAHVSIFNNRILFRGGNIIKTWNDLYDYIKNEDSEIYEEEIEILEIEENE